MPTNRRRTPRSRTIKPLTPGESNFLFDRDQPTGEPWRARFFMSPADYEALWINNRAAVLEWWIDNKPCSRPSQWFRYDAPKERHLQESQAAYLKRNGLLTADEVRYLKRHPGLLEPEEVTL